jgi:integrase
VLIFWPFLTYDAICYNKAYPHHNTIVCLPRVYLDARFDRDCRRKIQADAPQSRDPEHAIPKTRNWKATARLLGLTTPDLEPRGGGLAERWSDRLVATITPDDIHSLVNEARKYGVPGIERRVKGTTEQMARSMHSVLSKFFAWLVSQRVISVSPCHGLERPKPAAPRDRVLSDDEIRQFWRACDAIGPPFGPLFKVLLITGQRKSEVAGMTRDELNGTMWTIPKERSKNRRAHTVPLPPFARRLIASVEQGDRYVFTTTGHGPVKGFSTTKDRLRLAIPSWTLHDLRRTAAVGMARAGADLHVIERTLNHTSGSFDGIVGVYQLHKYADEIKMALEKWERLLLDIVR